MTLSVSGAAANVWEKELVAILAKSNQKALSTVKSCIIQMENASATASN
jgi:hypothetical protein